MARKPKRPTTARTSVSLPSDLKRRMDEVARDVNWSRVACRAFEAELAEIASKTRKTTMESVIQRLRASRAAASDDNLKTGIERGRDWAARRAKWEELRRLYEEFGGYTNAQWDDFCSLEPDAYGHIGALVRVIAPPGFFERSLAEEFGQNVFEEEYPAAELIQGFCVGALEVLAEVEAKL